jgi:uncharacterized membrane protein YgdD (TMEM256/DUF423 family)
MMPFTIAQRRWLLLFSIQGFLAVALGAFAAHGLKSTLSSEALSWWQTGCQYLFYHTLAGLFVGLLLNKIPALSLASLCFLLGNLLFAGSLFAMALTEIRLFGMITPLGGLLYLSGWSVLIFKLYRLSK